MAATYVVTGCRSPRKVCAHRVGSRWSILLTFKDSNGGGERHVSAVAEIGTRSISRNGCDAASSLISRAIAARYGCAANCREAVEDEAYAAGAISEATGAIPLLRERLRENEDALARFMLVFDVQ
jgi:hypothetical protein